MRYFNLRRFRQIEVVRNLGPRVNTEICDMTPHVTRDGTKLYFARIFEDGDRDVIAIEFDELLKSLQP